MGGIIKAVDPAVRAASEARVRAAIEAEVAAKRAAGVVIHGCDPEDYIEDAISEADAKVMVAEWTAALRVRFPGVWVSDPMSVAERSARLAFLKGQQNGVIPADEPFSWDPNLWNEAD